MYEYTFVPVFVLYQECVTSSV